MEWRRVWLVTAVSDDKAARRQKAATTVDELRALLDAARRNPAVWHVSFKPRRELVGDQPTHCVCGCEYRTRGSLPTPNGWLDCSCGGHLWWSCQECGQERVEPPVAYDCHPRHPSTGGGNPTAGPRSRDTNPSNVST